MKKIFVIAKYILKENISNKVFKGILYFGIMLIFMIFLLDDLAIYEGVRVIKDSGLFLIELFVMLIVIYISSTNIIKAIEEKSIYLILTKAVTKSNYIIGVNLGMIYSVFANVFFMGSILGVILFFKGALDLEYIIALLFIALKLSIISSIGIFFSIISDSFVMATIFTLFTYLLGHGVMEIKKIATRLSSGLFHWVLEAFYFILPKFNLLNYRDHIVDMNLNTLVTLGYVVVYIIFTTLLTSLFFEKKKL